MLDNHFKSKFYYISLNCLYTCFCLSVVTKRFLCSLIFLSPFLKCWLFFKQGPDGIGDYRPRSNYFPRYIGVGTSSPEATGDLSYLCRAAPNAPPPMPRQSYVGEVGWGQQYNQLLNSGTLLSNMQIKVRLKPNVYSLCKLVCRHITPQVRYWAWLWEKLE